MRADVQELADRFLSYAVAIVRVCNGLPGNVTGRHIAGQLLRSGTSAAANYEEACAAESRADFVHKMQIALKELRESRFWMRLITRSEIAVDPEFSTVMQEADELCRIVGKSVVTAKGNR